MNDNDYDIFELGNVKLVWTNGEVKKFDFQQQAAPQPKVEEKVEDDLPF